MASLPVRPLLLLIDGHKSHFCPEMIAIIIGASLSETHGGECDEDHLSLAVLVQPDLVIVILSESLLRESRSESLLSTTRRMLQLHRKKHLSTGRRGWLSEATRIDNVERLKLPKKHLSRGRRDWLGRETRAESVQLKLKKHLSRESRDWLSGTENVELQLKKHKKTVTVMAWLGKVKRNSLNNTLLNEKCQCFTQN